MITDWDYFRFQCVCVCQSFQFQSCNCKCRSTSQLRVAHASPSLQIPSADPAPVVSLSFLFPNPKYLGFPYEDVERHSGTGIKAFREKEEGFSDQGGFQCLFRFYKWGEMKCLSEKFFDRIYPKCKYELIHLTSNYYFRKEGVCGIHRSE